MFFLPFLLTGLFGFLGLGFLVGLLDLLKFLIASVLLLLVFVVALVVRVLGKPGALISSILSAAMSSAIVFQRVSPLGEGGWEISQTDILLFILLTAVFLGAIGLVGRGRRG